MEFAWIRLEAGHLNGLKHQRLQRYHLPGFGSFATPQSFGAVLGRTVPRRPSAKNVTCIEVAMMSRLARPPRLHRDALLCRDLVVVGRTPGGGDGAVVVVPVASNGSPFQLYVTLGEDVSAEESVYSLREQRQEQQQTGSSGSGTSLSHNSSSERSASSTSPSSTRAAGRSAGGAASSSAGVGYWEYPGRSEEDGYH
ncbi:hypothetical protein Taro_019054 [Colocasia esculenta]|uniref:Uncharacterized protein n=1 Tax=Colocasia esculenta TaxID=4460 RepID=A0A843USY6_COLES|nr:hypothetical protein [Colocasia esculenta]